MNQKDKQVRGTKGEADITASLRKAKLWNHKLVNAGYGTVFDKLIIPPGGGYAIEVKVRQEPTIGYNAKSITPNERKGLTHFEKLVGKGHAFILGIWKTEKFERAFLIPWYAVRDEVCSGVRGSIKMLDFPELKKVAGGWDMSCFEKGRE
ncbi:MAG: hypothetical protein QHH06_10430 [Clostridiales bacterium]|jgi:hypothetical protein|nr:hypothetical protein [Eubacteriales bacterium]MDH7566882.1 hypothetical protein [Clostridiales bacterium]